MRNDVKGTPLKHLNLPGSIFLMDKYVIFIILKGFFFLLSFFKTPIWYPNIQFNHIYTFKYYESRWKTAGKMISSGYLFHVFSSMVAEQNRKTPAFTAGTCQTTVWAGKRASQTIVFGVFSPLCAFVFRAKNRPPSSLWDYGSVSPQTACDLSEWARFFRRLTVFGRTAVGWVSILAQTAILHRAAAAAHARICSKRAHAPIPGRDLRRL